MRLNADPAMFEAWSRAVKECEKRWAPRFGLEGIQVHIEPEAGRVVMRAPTVNRRIVAPIAGQVPESDWAAALDVTANQFLLAAKDMLRAQRAGDPGLVH